MRTMSIDGQYLTRLRLEPSGSALSSFEADEQNAKSNPRNERSLNLRTCNKDIAQMKHRSSNHFPLLHREKLRYISHKRKTRPWFAGKTVPEIHQEVDLTMLPHNHRVTTLNQQFIQELPQGTNTAAQPTDNPHVISEDSSLGESSPRRSSRNRRAPARFMD
jgi:hypothetical protein